MRQDSGQDSGNSHDCVKDPGGQSGQHSGSGSRQHRDPDIMSAHQHHDADGASGTHGSIHGKIRDIQDTEGKINADRHNAPDKPLGGGSRQRVY